jgi:hypothetical protein
VYVISNGAQRSEKSLGTGLASTTVEAARERQRARFVETSLVTNADMGPAEIPQPVAFGHFAG